MESKDQYILSILIANNEFKGHEINLSEAEKKYLEDWIVANPTLTSDIARINALLERSSFKKEELLPDELDHLLGKILSGDKPGVKRKKG